MFWPVTNLARSEHKNTTTSAMSSGVPIRPAGVFATMRSTRSGKFSIKGAVRAVAIIPGETALQRTDGPYSRATLAQKAATPAFVAA
jgi:hypothetical protein